jgi:hypothetical protein
MNNGTYLASDINSRTPPRMEPTAGPMSRTSLATALNCYRNKQNGLMNRDCRFINKTAR